MMTNYNNFRQSLSDKPFRVVATLLLTLALLGVQTLLLQHEHDGDVSSHVDCSICIKHGSETDFLPTVLNYSSPIKSAGVVFSEPESESSVTPLITRSRGPPLVNS